MSSKFGFLEKFEFLQDILSIIVAKINSAVVHNVEKYLMLKKTHYLSALEHIDGAYLEFGVYKGSSFRHSIRCTKNLSKINPNLWKTKFIGFDSFNGFGDLRDADKHPFYTDQNFISNFDKVNKKIKRVGSNFDIRIVPGFFKDTLKKPASFYGIDKARIIFIDCDTFSSTAIALKFTMSTIQAGTYIILDDFFSYRGSDELGVAGAFYNFVKSNQMKYRQVLTYGMGGVVMVISSI